MEGKGLNLDGILQSVMQNPEMLKGVMELAGKLSANGSLSSLLSSDKEEAAPEETESLAVVAKPEVKKTNDMARHRKLLEALSLYVSEDKREKFELLLKLFDLMEFAGYLKH